jgi:sugar lactone lactonase YvrE
MNIGGTQFLLSHRAARSHVAISLLSVLLWWASAWAACAQVQFAWTNFVGLPCGANGTNDGTGRAARFALPYGVAVDKSNNVYVADDFNHVIRKATAAGEVTTWAGLTGQSGSVDGAGSAARFRYPKSVAVDNAGNVYVADTGNHVVRKVSPSGDVTTLAGLAGASGWADGDGSAARFKVPTGLAVDGEGTVYVADTFNQTIRKITPAGTVTSLAGGRDEMAFGTNDGAGIAARFNYPPHVAVDAAKNVYVADGHNETIRKITPAGLVTTLAGRTGYEGSADGIGSAAQFDNPQGLAVDNQGNIYVADTYNATIRMVSPAGVVTTIGNMPGHYGCIDGIGSAAWFSAPYDVAIDASGRLFVADTGGNRIVMGTPLPDLSRPAVTTASFSNSIFRLSCPTVTNKAYFLECNDALSNANWAEIGSVIGDGTCKSLSDSNAVSRVRFYRVRVQ